jgi:cell division protein FtsB
MSQKNDALRLEREILEKKVASMRPGQVDKDLLDEKVRLTLGFTRSDELLVVGN